MQAGILADFTATARNLEDNAVINQCAKDCRIIQVCIENDKPSCSAREQSRKSWPNDIYIYLIFSA
jgi:hypothetical protein